jgi:hypothetical protein
VESYCLTFESIIKESGYAEQMLAKQFFCLSLRQTLFPFRMTLSPHAESVADWIDVWFDVVDEEFTDVCSIPVSLNA